MADYAIAQLDYHGLPGVKGGSSGELRIEGLARSKDWDVAYDFAGKPRLSRSGFWYIPFAERDFRHVIGLLVPFGERDVLGHRPNPDLLRLLLSLKSIWSNAGGSIPNRIDDLIDEAANVQQMSPEIVIGYLLLFDTKADRRRREDELYS